MIGPLIGPVIGAAARFAGKELAKKGARQAAREAAKKAAKKEDLLVKGAIGAGGAAGAALANEYGESQSRDRMAKYREKLEREDAVAEKEEPDTGMRKGGMVKSSASRRGDGIAQRGKTKGRMV